MGPPPANRAMAIVNTAVYEAVNAITKRYPAGALKLEAAPGASVDAAIAAANRTAFSKLVPSQQSAIDIAYQAALSKIDDGASKTVWHRRRRAGGCAVLAMRADDCAAAETYRPQTAPGVYVPTVIPAVTHWPQRKPWLMTSPSQFRPGPPPALTSHYGRATTTKSKHSAARATRAARPSKPKSPVWEATLPPIYNGSCSQSPMFPVAR